jgi:small subunit ribosomal protein S9
VSDAKDDKETSESTPEETPEDAVTAGPDAASEEPAGGGSAPGLDPSEPASPAGEAPEADASEDAPADDAEPPAPDEAQDEAAAEEPVESPVAEQEEPAAEAEAPAAEEPAAEAEAQAAEEPAAEAEEPKETKKDVIPGADLEPIAVEQSEERPLSAEERAKREAEAEERAKREAALNGEGAEDDDSVARAPAKMESGSRFTATGKRKRSIARVTVLPGSGKIEVIKRELEEFFPRPLHQTMAKQPLTTTGYEDSVDVRVRVHGGGIGGQAGAVRHGIARALTEIDPELRGELKRRGYLTRDARVKERRKAGLKKARKRPQFSKR